MDPSTWIQWLKLPTRVVLALCIVLGAMIFASDKILGYLGLNTLIQEYRPYLGLGFLITFALLLVDILSHIWKPIGSRITDWNFIRQGKRRLHRLNPTEKHILQYYIQHQTRSQSLPLQNGAVNALQQESIIYRGSSIGTLSGFDFIIQPWAWEYLNKHPELLT